MPRNHKLFSTTSPKLLFPQATIGVKKSAYFPCSSEVIEFSLGEIVKTSLNVENRYDDVCIVQGIRFDRNRGVWLFGLRMLVSMSYWYESEKLDYQPNDEFEVEASMLMAMEERDMQRFEAAINNYQTVH